MLRCLTLLFAILLSTLTVSAQQQQFPSDSRLKPIIDKKTIRIAYRTDATPFSFANDKNQAVGFSIDLCQMVTKSIAQQFSLGDIAIEWVPVNVQTRLSTVSGGKADLECGSSTVTLGRMKDVDFSNIIFVESTGIVVARSANLHSFADLAGRKVAVISGTTNERAVAEQSRLHNLNVTLVSVKDRDEGVAALASGKVDGYASDKLLLVGNHMKNADSYVMLPDDLSVESYAIVLPRGDWALRLAVNTGLAQIYRSGVIVNVFQKWFDQLGLQPGVLSQAAWALGGLGD